MRRFFGRVDVNFDCIVRILFVFIHRNDEKLFGFELWFNVGSKEVFGMR